jgi:hypothetical protein
LPAPERAILFAPTKENATVRPWHSKTLEGKKNLPHRLRCGHGGNRRHGRTFLLRQHLGAAKLVFFRCECRLRFGKLILQLGDRAHKVVAAAARRLGGERIVEMGWVGHAVAAFLELNLRIEFLVFSREVLDHEVHVGNLTALFLGAETVQPQERLA